MKTDRQQLDVWILPLAVTIVTVILAGVAQSQPQGATVNNISHDDGNASNPDSRSDDGGTINTVNLNNEQQNSQWKAYVGNVTGSLTLDDSSGNTIYDWTIAASDIQGEVYISRNSSVTWSGVKCANSTTISNEESALNINGSAVDSISNTFNSTVHDSMQVGSTDIGADSCNSTATYVNDSKDTPIENASFQEILLQGGGNEFVYATNINQDTSSYKSDNTTFDFQTIVADDVSTTYYFYLEISS